MSRRSKPAARGASAGRGGRGGNREAKLMETLHDAEIRQQQSFIKSRSEQLDREIKSMREHLKLADSSIENESLRTAVASATDLKVQGFGLGKVEFNDDKYTQSVSKMKNNLPQFQLDESKSNIKPKTVKDHLVMFLAKIKLSKTAYFSSTCKAIVCLTNFQLLFLFPSAEMEDVNMTSAELRELLLPSDLVVPDEVSNAQYCFLCIHRNFFLPPFSFVSR